MDPWLPSDGGMSLKYYQMNNYYDGYDDAYDGGDDDDQAVYKNVPGSKHC